MSATTYRGAFDALLADARAVRKEGPIAKPPMKGIRRSVLIGGWLAVHTFELVVLLAYGAFGKGPWHAAWWLLTAMLAFVLYVRVVFSDPGFVDAALLQRLVDETGLQVTVAGTDASRGLLADVEAALPRMEELLPVDEQTGAEAPAAASGGKARAHPPSGGGGRARVAPSSSSGEASSSTDAPPATEMAEVELQEAEEAEEVDEEAEREARIRRTLAFKPRIVGIREPGQEEAEAELERQRQERMNKPLGIEDYFYGFCEPADMHLPIRAKFTKKHGRVIAKFDHHCYMLGNSVGELNHGHFWRLLFVQTSAIWIGKWLLDVAYLDWGRRVVWAVANMPLLLLNLLTWVFGIPLSLLLVTHTFMALTSTTTYEWLKLEKLDYMKGFYEFSFPFNEGPWTNLRHFCCPAGIKLWRRPPPESDWPDTCWRNKYYSCFG